MENAADALKMAGFMLIFVAALSLAMTTLSKAKSAATAIIYANNKRNDYSYLQQETSYPVDGTNRLVGIETIIPTIYKYRDETYKIEFYDTAGKPLNIIPTNIRAPFTQNGVTYNELKSYPGSSQPVIFINFYDLAWEYEGHTQTIQDLEWVVKYLIDNYDGTLFIEKLDEKEKATVEEDENGYVSKEDEQKSKSNVRIISYTLKN